MGTVTRLDDRLDGTDIDNIAQKMFGQISSPELYRVALYCGISDVTMETLKSQYHHSPVTLLSSILLHWVRNNHPTTRHHLAVLLNNLGISPNSIMEDHSVQ